MSHNIIRGTRLTGSALNLSRIVYRAQYSLTSIHNRPGHERFSRDTRPQKQ